MRIADHSLAACRKLQKIWQQRLTQVLHLDCPERFVIDSLRHLNKANSEIKQLLDRSKQLTTTTFNINIFSEQECLINFHFTKAHLSNIANLLSWPGSTNRNRYSCDPITAVCILCHRLATPTRWTDVEMASGMHASKLSEVFWEVCYHFNQVFEYVLTVRKSSMQSRADRYANAIRVMGAAYNHCVGFIDCTKLRIQRPGGNPMFQRACYSGHKRMHCLVFLTICTPDGLMFSLHGPQTGRRHDLTLLRESGWEETLGPCLLVNDIQFFVYGDSAFLLRPWMQCAFQTQGASDLERKFNRDMSALRVFVEHNYKDLKQYWTSNDFARNLKVRKIPIGLLYKASAILLNFHACLYKCGQTVQSFKVSPPSLDEYLSFT